ncbi:S-adenosyl-L-methionine-dependent methyltransferase [Sistotremastrum suecicum HHB10207 ss-3]|uniref:Protein-lysine N-methyltransferase EFM4 n=1 Tax=Sistotremastrum suecicum HHB10207 ss-3 TaxID=1314776 RepID=A0A166G1Y0_9AGAM|nr:S-adenosyl-L-methionine-dependent methyltransferase [Sistotremastrum suecicum HHB10207 ss-3]
MANFQSSKLGTKDYWDNVYKEELENFAEHGDEGEIWFGEDSMEKMVTWTSENVPSDKSPNIVEVGMGNGLLLVSLVEQGYDGAHLCGIDFSPESVQLAQGIAQHRGEQTAKIVYRQADFLRDPVQSLRHMTQPPLWDLVLDKGTYDAISLAEKKPDEPSPASLYPPKVVEYLAPGGLFLITSCNFTEEELRAVFETQSTGLQYHSRIAHKTYTYGGKTGSICSTVAFQKAAAS